MNARRILIVGAPGGGKTTLAPRLAARIGAPWFELDTVIYERGYGVRRSYTERKVLVGQILDRACWVVEGNYLWWADLLYREADLVVWLDFPWHIATAHVVLRHFKASLAGTNRHPGHLVLLRFLSRYPRYYFAREADRPAGPEDDSAGNWAATALFLSAYEHKLVRCRTRADVEALCASVADRREV